MRGTLIGRIHSTFSHLYLLTLPRSMEIDVMLMTRQLFADLRGSTAAKLPSSANKKAATLTNVATEILR